MAGNTALEVCHDIKCQHLILDMILRYRRVKACQPSNISGTLKDIKISLYNDSGNSKLINDIYFYVEGILIPHEEVILTLIYRKKIFLFQV